MNVHTRRRRWTCLPITAALFAATLAGCSGGTGGRGTITLYNGQHPQLTQKIVAAFEKQTGIHVKLLSNDGVVLADQLLQEGTASPADVYLTENSPELMLLEQHHLLATLPASTLSQIPARYSSPAGDWVGVALRVSALVYNPSLISPAGLPATIDDLSESRFKGKLAVAPSDSDFVPLVGALLATDGSALTKQWLKGLLANGSFYQDDEAVVAAVNRGSEAIGIINQYYWYRLRLELGASHMHSALYFFPNHDVGSIENISGVAVLAASHHKVDAERFVSFLVSAVGQRIISSSDDFEYPARDGIKPNPALEPLATIQPDTLDVIRLGNDRPAAALLQELGLT